MFKIARSAREEFLILIEQEQKICRCNVLNVSNVYVYIKHIIIVNEK